MLAWNKENARKAAPFLIVFAVGFVAGKFLKFDFKKAESDQQMVEKIGEDSLKLSEETLKSLTITPVKFGPVPEELKVLGKISVAEDKTTVVAARIGGRIDKINVASASVVKAGEVLATIFSPDYIIAREEYLQTLAQVKANNDPEDRNVLSLARQKLETMGVSRYDIDHLETADKNSNLVVRAPRSGAVIEKKAVIGTLVNPGDSLFTIGDTSSVWFAGDIYPADLDKVKKGQEVIVDPENGGKPLHGKLSFISPMVDSATRTIKVRAEMENSGNALRLDMYVRGNIILNEKDAMTIPKSALVRDGNSFICFKELPNRVFKKVQIETSGESHESIIITKGLEATDKVVSDGALLLVSALSTTNTGAEE